MSSTFLNELKAYVEAHEGFSATIVADGLIILPEVTKNPVKVYLYQQAKDLINRLTE